MEKILVAVNPNHTSTSAVDFACYLARVTNSGVTGVFLEDQGSYYTAAFSTIGNLQSTAFDTIHDEKNNQADTAIANFRSACCSRSVNCGVHRDRGVPTEELVKESRFADLLVIDAELSLSGKFDGLPSAFVKSVLKKAECPVIIAPDQFSDIEEIVFAYNGSPSCVFAMKQFTLLFPQFADKKVTVLEVNSKGQWNNPEKHALAEWLNDHYNNVQFEALKGNIATALFDYLFKPTDIFIVMGAYGRTQLSQLIKNNPADSLIKTLGQPIFITHL